MWIELIVRMIEDDLKDEMIIGIYISCLFWYGLYSLILFGYFFGVVKNYKILLNLFFF